MNLVNHCIFAKNTLFEGRFKTHLLHRHLFLFIFREDHPWAIHPGRLVGDGQKILIQIASFN